MERYVSVIGGMNVDIKGVTVGNLIPETSNPGKVGISPGGVGRNIAHNLALLGIPAYLLGAVGDDTFGAYLLAETQKAGINTDNIRIVKNQSSGLYLSIFNASCELAVAISDMASMQRIDLQYLAENEELIRHSSFVVADTNLEIAVLSKLQQICEQAHVPLLIEPVSVKKAQKLLAVEGTFDYVTPNKAELEVLNQQTIEQFDDLEKVCGRSQSRYRHLLVTSGKEGVFSYTCEQQAGRWYPAISTRILDVTGAGDAFVAGFVCGVVRNLTIDESIRIGLSAAALTLQSKETVNPQLSLEQCLTLL